MGIGGITNPHVAKTITFFFPFHVTWTSCPGKLFQQTGGRQSLAFPPTRVQTAISSS